MSKDYSHTLPTFKLDTQSEKEDSMFKSNRRSSLPVPAGRGAHVTSIGSKPGQPPHTPGHADSKYRFLSAAEWARVAHGVGAISEGETHHVVHPTCWYYPPKGLPPGLYRDVVYESTKMYYSFHLLSIVRWGLMIGQIILGAIMTALGSLVDTDATPITILAAINTVDAGLLALMHNSGLPDRYRMNRVEFIKVEDWLKQLLDTGVIRNSQTVDEVLSDCYKRFQLAKSTVLSNMPDSYTLPPGKKKNKALAHDKLAAGHHPQRHVSSGQQNQSGHHPPSQS